MERGNGKGADCSQRDQVKALNLTKKFNKPVCLLKVHAAMQEYDSGQLLKINELLDSTQAYSWFVEVRWSTEKGGRLNYIVRKFFRSNLQTEKIRLLKQKKKKIQIQICLDLKIGGNVR